MPSCGNMRDIARLRDAGASEEIYRASIAASLYREALQEELGIEAGVLAKLSK